MRRNAESRPKRAVPCGAFGPEKLDENGRIVMSDEEPKADECRSWLRGLEDAGVEIFIPEIVDHEVGRELSRINAMAGLGRLNRFSLLPLDRASMLRAADL